jgi:hypothetical protein
MSNDATNVGDAVAVKLIKGEPAKQAKSEQKQGFLETCQNEQCGCSEAKA